MVQVVVVTLIRQFQQWAIILINLPTLEPQVLLLELTHGPTIQWAASVRC